VSGGGGPTSFDGIRVVVADDDAAFVEALVMLVDGQPGLTVVGSAANGLEAIELVDAVDPEAVVIDLHMPLLDGVTAIARMRADNPSLCLIALTGDTDPQLHEAVREAGADAVLLKAEFLQGLLERLGDIRESQTGAHTHATG
jgi:DNA-binding NarL/FixJ family response regulator